MKTFWSVTVGFLFSFSFAGQLIGAPQFDRDRGPGQGQDRVCVYKDIHYQGVEQCFNAGDTVSTLQSLSGQVSSIRIYGGARVIVYDATNFRGHTTMFTSSMPDLGQVRLDTKSWSDRIQSLQVSSGNASNGPYGNAPAYRGPERGPFSNQQINEGVCVYERPNYQGRSQCWNAGEQLDNLARSGNWNDRILSIRVFGRTTAVAYRNIGFGGANFVVNRDIPDLAQVSASGVRNWDHQISSLRIENGGENGFPGRGRDRDRERERFQD